MKQFDYMNDIHLDFWVPLDHNIQKLKQKLEAFAESLVPFFPSKVLVIGGDLGHYNKQNVLFLEILSTYYEHIILVFGNHDYYLISSNMANKFKKNSYLRAENMKQLTSHMPTVHYFEGHTLHVDGITFGGTGMWYDFSYHTKTLEKSMEEARAIYYEISKDPKRLRGLPNIPEAMFKEETKRLEAIIDESDVIITHVGPDDFFSPYVNEMMLCNSFYFFDGSSYKERIQNKIWCFGHVHITVDTMKDGCRFISHALGYPDESPKKKIKTILVS